MIIDSDNLRLHSNIRLISKFIQADINSLPISSQISFSVSGDTFRDTRPGSARLTNNTFLSVDGVKSDVRIGEASLQTRFTFSYKQYYDLIFDIRLMSNPYIEGHDIEFKMSEGFVYDELTQCYSEEQTALVWRVPYRGRMSVSSSLQQDTQGYRQRYSGPLNYQTTMTIGPIRGVLNPAAGATLLFPLSQLQKFIGTRTRSFIQKNLETSAAFSQKPGLGFILRGRRSGGDLQFSTSASGRITAQQRSRASVQTNFLFQAAGGIKGPLIPGRYSISASFNATGYREKKFVGPVNYQTNTQFTASYSPQKTWEYTTLDNFSGNEYVIRGEEFFDGNALYDISNGSVIRNYSNSLGAKTKGINPWYNTSNYIQMNNNYVAMVNSSNLVRVLDKATGSIVRDFANPISGSSVVSIGLGQTHLSIWYTKNESYESRTITISYINIYNIQSGLEVSSIPYITGGTFPSTYPGWNADQVWGMVTNNGICVVTYTAYTGFYYNTGTQYGPIEPKEPTLYNGTNTYPFYSSFMKIIDLNSSSLDYNLRPVYTNRAVAFPRNTYSVTDTGKIVTPEAVQSSPSSFNGGYKFNASDTQYTLYFSTYSNSNVLSAWTNPTFINSTNESTLYTTFGNIIRPENYYPSTNIRSYYKYNYAGSGLTDNTTFQAIYANDEYQFIKIIKQVPSSGWVTNERNVIYVMRTSDNTLFDVINEGRIATENDYVQEYNHIRSNVTEKYFIAGRPNTYGLGIRIFRNTTKP